MYVIHVWYMYVHVRTCVVLYIHTLVREDGTLGGVRIHDHTLPLPLLVRPQVHHATGIPEGQTLTGRTHVHGTHHDVLGVRVHTTDHHVGRSDQPSQVQQLELPNLGDDQDGGADHRDAANEEGLEHDYVTGGHGTQETKVKDL